MLVGGTTAFIVALSYVSANAIWYQPHFHSGAFFATRDTNYVGPPDPDMQETTIRIERPDGEARPAPKPDPVVEKVQAMLKSMNLYDGDGRRPQRPEHAKAIAAYRKTMGMDGSGEIDEALLEQLGAGETTAGIAPQAACDRQSGAGAGKPAMRSRQRPQLVTGRPATDPMIIEDPGGPEGIRQRQDGDRRRDRLADQGRDPRVPVAVRPAGDRRAERGGLCQDARDRAGGVG